IIVYCTQVNTLQACRRRGKAGSPCTLCALVAHLEAISRYIYCKRLNFRGLKFSRIESKLKI
ncbi:MAG: hypothetical protein PV344_03445, partial [Anaplasma sp.]|nr:hypothetical protein [Anaplasma sp.]